MVAFRKCEHREFPLRFGPDVSGRRSARRLLGNANTRFQAQTNRTGREKEKEMLKLLRGKKASEAGFTLMELLVVVLIVGILAAVGVPLYLGYVRDSRLAEAKALAGAALTAAQACAFQNSGSEATNCTTALLSGRMGTDTAGVTGDGRWTVAVTTVTLDTVNNNRFLGGPVTVSGIAAPLNNLAAGIFISGTGVLTIRCRTITGAVTSADGTC